MRLADLPDPRPVKIAVFALIGLLSGVGAVIDTSRLEAAAPNAGAGLELQVIAAESDEVIEPRTVLDG